MPRKFTYRGFSVEELQTMPMDEFIKVIPARQRRSLLRGLPNRQKKFLEKLRRVRRALKKGKKITIRTHNRDSIITPEMIGVTVAVHNGIEFIEFLITPNHIGQYLGEFAPTRKRVMHGTPGIGATKSSQYVPLK